jgi:hypothetical protein
MKTKHLTIVLFLMICCSNLQAQSAVEKMQTLMKKIMEQAPDNFKNVKGAEVGRNDRMVAYKADLTKTITDPVEMKKALANNLFGAMLTTEDNIVDAGGSTIYLVRYSDPDLVAVAAKAFTDLPTFLGKSYDAKIEELKTDALTVHNYVITVKGVAIARLDYDGLAHTCQIIIGIKR